MSGWMDLNDYLAVDDDECTFKSVFNIVFIGDLIAFYFFLDGA